MWKEKLKTKNHKESSLRDVVGVVKIKMHVSKKEFIISWINFLFLVIEDFAKISLRDPETTLWFL